METKKTKTTVVVGLLALAGLAVIFLPAYAGDLEPSAPPAPTMKTLDEVEPRIPIPASETPAGSFTILQSGSYYFTGDRTASGTGIIVEVDGVTIDLMGYSLIGPGSGFNYGIYMNGRKNVEIRNGTVRDFGYTGIYESSDSGIGHRVINVRSISNGQSGIDLPGKGHLIKNCTVAENSLKGIGARWGCMVTGNTAHANGSIGISVYWGSTVTDNTTSMNTVDGILVYRECRVVDNSCFWNGYLEGDGAGIRVTGIYNHIEHNTVTSNDRGIDVDDEYNLIVRNSAVCNVTEYDIVEGNKVGTISTDPTTAGPWDNFILAP